MPLQKYNLNENSVVEFHTILIRKENGDYIIGREEIDTYITVPEIGVEAIRLMEKSLTIGMVKKQLMEKYKEEINIISFVENLIKIDFVKKINDTIISSKIQPKKYLFSRIKQHHVQWLFSKPALIVYFIFILFLFVVMALNSDYIPKPMDIFFYDRVTIVALVSLGLGWLLTLKHELAHLFAAKYVGVEGRFSISHRLHFIVAETNVTNLWKVPKEKRYVVYFAGILSDLVLSALLVLFLVLYDYRLISFDPLVYRISKMIILLQLMSVLWQFRFYMRTDLYYVVATKCNCKNLFNDAVAFVKNKLSKLFKRINVQDLTDIPPSELKIIKIYSVFLFFGTLVTILLAVVYGLPITIELLNRIYNNIVLGISNGDQIRVIDGIVVISISVFNFLLLLFVIIRRRMEKRYKQ